MDTNEYKHHLSARLIKEFKDKFYEKVGVVPSVYIGAAGMPRLPLQELYTKVNGQIPGYLKEDGYNDIKAASRKEALVWLRIIFCSLARGMNYSLSAIGDHLNGRDHTTVMHNLKNFERLALTNETFRSIYNDSLALLNLQPGNYEPTSLRIAA
jgi:hypothetical protein